MAAAMNWRAWAVIGAAGVSLALGCTKPVQQTPGPTEPSVGLEVRKKLLEESAACVVSTARDFETRAAALEAATATLASAPDAGTVQAARDAFRAAMAAWQIQEVMKLGPAAPTDVKGGEDLRERIYSYPLVSRCAVEETVVSQGYGNVSALAVNRKGLAALEYLLFFEGQDTACAGTSQIVSSGSWAGLSADARAERKRAYARAVAADLKVTAGKLVQAWAPEGGNFAGKLAGAGTEGSPYANTAAALNALSDAMFYLEREVKDLKLARPIGLRDCDVAPCPELAESPFEKKGKANLLSNLDGFTKLYQGCGADFAGTGFDDLLADRESAALAERIKTDLAAARAAVAALPDDDVAVDVVSHGAAIRAAYDKVKLVTDELKTDFVTVLDLEAPQSLEGDND